jgi:hypothetical protein
MSISPNWPFSRLLADIWYEKVRLHNSLSFSLPIFFERT